MPELGHGWHRTPSKDGTKPAAQLAPNQQGKYQTSTKPAQLHRSGTHWPHHGQGRMESGSRRIWVTISVQKSSGGNSSWGARTDTRSGVQGDPTCSPSHGMPIPHISCLSPLPSSASQPTPCTSRGITSTHLTTKNPLGHKDGKLEGEPSHQPSHSHPDYTQGPI